MEKRWAVPGIVVVLGVAGILSPVANCAIRAMTEEELSAAVGSCGGACCHEESGYICTYSVGLGGACQLDPQKPPGTCKDPGADCGPATVLSNGGPFYNDRCPSAAGTCSLTTTWCVKYTDDAECIQYYTPWKYCECVNSGTEKTDGTRYICQAGSTPCG